MKEVRQFLSSAGYYRRSIKGFASIVRPLNDQLIGHTNKKQKRGTSKKRTPFKWTDAQQKAFDNIKEQLTNPPVLGFADYNKPFTLHVDVSSTGLSELLCQKKDRPIAYARRSLK